MTKERPILFSAPMVRALLAGTKTQTRRVAKSRYLTIADICAEATWNMQKAHPDMGVPPFRFLDEDGRAFALLCPYGRPGGRLWVRESWAVRHDRDHLKPRDIAPGERVYYAADAALGGDNGLGGLRGRPGMFMPRWASRITLEITGVRVERLQEISEADAEAEGCQAAPMSMTGVYCGADVLASSAREYRDGYSTLWESINGAGSWEANPLVWVVEFRAMARELESKREEIAS